MIAMTMQTRVLACWLLLALTGCASGPIGVHQPAIANVELLRGINAVAVGDFGLAATAPPSIDKSVSSRGSVLSSPRGNSFADYLRDSLLIELRTAGRYDASSPVVIASSLTRNELNTGVSTGDATLAATVTVTRNGITVYEKTVTKQHTWKSSFVGAVAIPEAINQYTEMFTRWLAALYGDEDFRKACAATVRGE